MLAFALVSLTNALTASAQVATEPIKIGVLTDLSGPFADIGGRGSVVAAEMAVHDFGGSVLGQPIGVVSADPQLKPDNAGAIARRWFDREGVSLIVDLPSSPVALAVQAIAGEKKRVSITSSAATDVLTNQQCSAYGAHWTYDSYAVGKTVAASLASPGSTWFFITADNSGGEALQNSLTPFLQARGAKVLGSVRFAQHTAEMSPFLIDAQASGAQFIAFAGAGADLINTIKQAREFGLSQRGQRIVGTAVFVSDLRAIGLDEAGGLLFPAAWVTDASSEAEEWSKRFFAQQNAMPNAVQAGVYSAVLHYLKAVRAAGTDQADAVMTKMREMPIEDMFTKHGVLRKDGLMVHDMYLVQAKKPSESTGPWDLVRVVRTVPGVRGVPALVGKQMSPASGIELGSGKALRQSKHSTGRCTAGDRHHQHRCSDRQRPQFQHDDICLEATLMG